VRIDFVLFEGMSTRCFGRKVPTELSASSNNRSCSKENTTPSARQTPLTSHHLATRDARHNLPLIKRLAKSSLAENPITLVIDIVYPPKLDLHPLAEHEKHSSKISPETSANAEARSEELTQRARAYPGKYGLIQSKMANGQGLQSVLSIVPGSFWDGWSAAELDEEEDILTNAGEENSDFL